MAAENARGNRHVDGVAPRFNEAAANGRGKLLRERPHAPPLARFNEAAANGRGKPLKPMLTPCRPRAASMRPRRMAAENAWGRSRARIGSQLQ